MTTHQVRCRAPVKVPDEVPLMYRVTNSEAQASRHADLPTAARLVRHVVPHVVPSEVALARPVDSHDVHIIIPVALCREHDLRARH